MADKSAIAGSLFRGALLGGAWLRLAAWRKNGKARRLEVVYEDAGWSLRLLEGTAVVYEGTSDTFEGVTHLATVALGKAL